MSFGEVVEKVGQAVDGVGVVMMVVGVSVSLIAYAVQAVRAEPEVAYRDARRRMGRSILLGLEVLVAGDIIRTVAVTPTFTSVGTLAIIVGIRTFLSMTLEVEISGRWPWQGAPSQPETSAAAPAAAPTT